MGKTTYAPHERKKMNKAMRLSLGVGFFMLLIKCYAYFLTGSSAILSDSTESVVHIFAVGFAAYSMWLSHKPADKDHPYGHDRITFFSAGFEGALIMIASLYILYHALQKVVYGFELENLDQGMAFITTAMVVNGGLGLYLIRQGKRYHSLVLEADGKHILTDCVTSLGVIAALVLTHLTGWIYFDPLIALLIGLNILWTGIKLLHNAFHGLMDRTDPSLDTQIRQLLKEGAQKYQIGYHNLRMRDAGNRLLIEVHLLFPSYLPISRAHEVATHIEQHVERAFGKPTELVTHLEPFEGHDEIHKRVLGRGG
jgi:cation diffusion facilitator family transporter